MSDPDKQPSQPKLEAQPKLEEQPKAESQPKAEPGASGGREREESKHQPLPGRRFGKHRPGRKEAEEPIQAMPEVEEHRAHVSLRELDSLIEREMQEAMGDFSVKDAMGAEGRGQQGAKPGSGQQQKKGRIVAIHLPDIFLDIPGGRSQGVLSADQFPEGVPAVGTDVDVHIEGYDQANGLLILSRQGAAVHVDWSSVAEGMIVEARITGVNKGGLSVEVNGIRGFMPISQIDLYRVENAETFVNQRLRCMVTEVNPEERNLVVSRRALMEKERQEQAEQTWNSLAEGQIREGIVRSIREFGAFVDIGGMDGLVHVSDMAWSRVQDPTTVLQPGQAVKVLVLRIDREKRKLSLGLKQLQASPWDTIEQDFPVSTKVPGKVTK